MGLEDRREWRNVRTSSSLILAAWKQGFGLFSSLYYPTIQNNRVYKMNEWSGERWVSREILYIRMAQDQGQRGWQRQEGRGSAIEGHSPENRLRQKGEIQARNLQSKGQDLDHLWLDSKAPKSEVGRVWSTGTDYPQRKRSLILTLGSFKPLLPGGEPCPQRKEVPGSETSSCTERTGVYLVWSEILTTIS